MTAFEGMGYTASGSFTTLALQQIVAMSSSNLSAKLADLALIQRVGRLSSTTFSRFRARCCP